MESVNEQGEFVLCTCQCRGRGKLISHPSGVFLSFRQVVTESLSASRLQSGAFKRYDVVPLACVAMYPMPGMRSSKAFVLLSVTFRSILPTNSSRWKIGEPDLG